MSIVSLFQTLNDRNISLTLDSGLLKISAPKGAITKDLHAELKEKKSEIISWLESISGNEPELPSVNSDVANQFDTFELLDLQTGFLVADDEYMEFQVRPHYYFERDFEEEIDILRFQDAWDKALNHHRGAIAVVTKMSQLQLLKEIPKIKVKVNDYRALETDEAHKKLLEIRNIVKRQELPLDTFPWFDLQVSFWREGNSTKSRMHFNNNNFFIDGFGTNKLHQLVEKFYVDPELSILPIEISLRDVSKAFDELEESESGIKSKKYWLDRIADLPDAPAFPQINGKNRRSRARMERIRHIIPSDKWQNFKQLAALHGLTPSNAITAAYAELVYAFSGSKHFILNHMVTRRFPMHPDINRMLGNFASLYPLEIDLREGKSFLERAKILQKRITDDMNHLHWGGMKVLQALNQYKNEIGRSPSAFVISSGLSMKDLKETNYACLETCQTLIDHQFREFDDGRCIYIWDLLEEFFPKGFISAMWESYVGFIDKLCDDKDFWLHDFHQFTPSTQLYAREHINDTKVSKPEELLQEALVLSADRAPNSTAILYEKKALTYHELFQQSQAISDFLKEQDIRPNELVAVVLPKSTDLVSSVYGILSSGGAYVPVDINLPESRISYLLQNSKARFVFTDSATMDQLICPESVEKIIDVNTILSSVSDKHANIIAQQPVQTLKDLAYVIYTSGSTGRPKGVMIDHLGAMNTVVDINRRFNITASDRIFAASSFSFDLSVYDLFGSVLAGAILVYPDKKDTMNPAHWVDVMRDAEVTVWNSAPPLIQLLVDAAQRKQVILPSLRLVMLSGDWIPLNLPVLIKKIAPNAQVISLGGATEASIWSIYYPIESINPEWQSIPYGYPMDNQTWYILDDDMRPVPEWVSGNLFIGGIGLAKGYWQDAEKTNKSFLPHPNTGETIYRTGDLGRYTPEGYIEFLGRSDFQVKIQGFRIELGEIESAIIAHDAINEAVVIAKPVENSREKTLVAYLVPDTFHVQSDKDTLINGVTEFIGQKLPDYMVPRQFAILNELPLSSNGKLDRKALPDVDLSEKSSTVEYKAPQTELEKRLVDIWLDVLNLENPIGINDDFFDLGGRSFDAVRIIAIIKDEMDISLSLASIWQGRTVSNLAQTLEENNKHETRVLLQINNHGEALPFYMIHPAGGHVMSYLELGQQFNGPLFGLQAIGVDGNEKPQKTIEEMAETYIDSILETQGKNPFILGGWSSGGIIAFEAARQLEAMGMKLPAPIFLLDTPSPIEDDLPSVDSLLAWFIEDLNLGVPAKKLSFSELVDLDSEEQLRRSLEQVKQLTTLPSDLSVDQLLPVYEVFKAVVIAGRNYQPQKINTDIMLFRAKNGIVSEFTTHPHFTEDSWGWPDLTNGKVSAITTNGSHYTILREPNVNTISNTINNLLTELHPLKKPITI